MQVANAKAPLTQALRNKLRASPATAHLIDANLTPNEHHRTHTCQVHTLNPDTKPEIT